MKETLTCTQCEKRWKRERSRGRKPNFCPKCVKDQNKKIQHDKKNIVQVTEVKKDKKIFKLQKQNRALNSTENNSSKEELSVGLIYNYYHPSDNKLREETKGGSKWKCKCGYTFETKFSLTATPTHKCNENGRSIPMTRIDK
jgi:hypothetical protein